MDKRDINTKRKIKNSLLRLSCTYPISSLSIQEITDEAGISRATFYNHYKNKKDILLTIENHLDQIIQNKLKEVTKNYDIVQFIADHILTILYEHHNELNILYNSDLRGQWILYLENIYYQWTNYLFEDYNESNVQIPKTIAHRYFVKIFLSIISTWLTSPVIEPPEIFKPIFLKLMNTPLVKLY